MTEKKGTPTPLTKPDGVITVSYTHLNVLKTEYAHKRRYLNPFGGESNAVFLCPQERVLNKLKKHLWEFIQDEELGVCRNHQQSYLR